MDAGIDFCGGVFVMLDGLADVRSQDVYSGVQKQHAAFDLHAR